MAEAETATFPGLPETSPTQAFFAAYAAEIRGPNYGDHARDWVRTMLARAELAKLYVPETP